MINKNPFLVKNYIKFYLFFVAFSQSLLSASFFQNKAFLQESQKKLELEAFGPGFKKKCFLFGQELSAYLSKKNSLENRRFVMSSARKMRQKIAQNFSKDFQERSLAVGSVGIVACIDFIKKDPLYKILLQPERRQKAIDQKKLLKAQTRFLEIIDWLILEAWLFSKSARFFLMSFSLGSGQTYNQQTTFILQKRLEKFFAQAVFLNRYLEARSLLFLSCSFRVQKKPLLHAQQILLRARQLENSAALLASAIHLNDTRKMEKISWLGRRRAFRT